MKRLVIVIALLVAGVAAAQDLATYNKGLSAYNSNNFSEASRLFFEVYNTTTDNDTRLKAEYYLASSFQRQGLPFAAYIYFDPIVKAGPKHPFHLKAVEALINLQEELGDDYLIPSALNKLYDRNADAWATLPLEVLARINYLIGRIAHRNTKLDEAKQFLEAVPDTSQVYAKAQYLLGIALADPRFPAANDAQRKKNVDDALAVFVGVTKIDPRAKQKDLVETQQLATLALGRTNYNIGEYAQSVSSYESIPRFSKYWDQALFENGFARFQNDDLGGALGSLQALHAPQFTGAFQPESWVLKSTVYYFACLYEESKSALNEFESIYLPMVDKLRPFAEEPKELSAYFALVEASRDDVLPRPVLLWVRANERMLGVYGMIKQLDAEKARINDNQSWKSAKLSPELVTYLDQNRSILEQLAGRLTKDRILSAYRTIKGFADQAEIIRFEIAKAGKEIAESGVDQASVLRKQTLYRPGMPAENWNYWKFQGEFWRDEIGYYQYTLKRGCPAN
ncbi:MAG: tetratricopeptide repeat protein [Archangium sp.]|nr:tetratricopeptide repeat protein [Archangium sp.]